MSKPFGWIVGTLALLGFGAWVWAFHGPCGISEVRDTQSQLSAIAGRWTDALRLAGATPRNQLAGPLATLQASRREADELVVPVCLLRAKTDIVKAMDFGNESLIQFMEADANDEFLVGAAASTAAIATKQARSELDRALAAVGVVVGCAPLCKSQEPSHVSGTP